MIGSPHTGKERANEMGARQTKFLPPGGPSAPDRIQAAEKAKVSVFLAGGECR